VSQSTVHSINQIPSLNQYFNICSSTESRSATVYQLSNFIRLFIRYHEILYLSAIADVLLQLTINLTMYVLQSTVPPTIQSSASTIIHSPRRRYWPILYCLSRIPHCLPLLGWRSLFYKKKPVAHIFTAHQAEFAATTATMGMEAISVSLLVPS
jgi:hypothetical protein